MATRAGEDGEFIPLTPGGPGPGDPLSRAAPRVTLGEEEALAMTKARPGRRPGHSLEEEAPAMTKAWPGRRPGHSLGEEARAMTKARPGRRPGHSLGEEALAMTTRPARRPP